MFGANGAFNRDLQASYLTSSFAPAELYLVTLTILMHVRGRPSTTLSSLVSPSLSAPKSPR